jgi:hypothetical protein
MEKNQIECKRIQSIDVDENQNLYILDDESATVIRYDLKTGAFVKKISSWGQGAAELMMPSVIRVINKKVFMLSEGYNGVKIFSADGDYLGGFKTARTPRWMDVANNENIYIAETDHEANPIISVYDLKGRKIRTAATFPLRGEILDNKASFFMHAVFKFRLDPGGNIIVLFDMLRDLKKISPGGEILWERTIENSLIKPFLQNEGVRYEEGHPVIRSTVYSLEVDREGNVIIGHVGGGCIYNPKGELIDLLEIESTEKREIPPPLCLIKIFGEKIIGVYPDGSAYIFDYKLNGK